MALTFPEDITQPYVDTASGLKYVYNTGVGAWESAIQPPVIIAENEPGIALDGFLWYKPSSQVVYIKAGSSDQPPNPRWVLLTTSGSGGTDENGNPIPQNLVTISPNPPSDANGKLWWDNETGRLMIFYEDGNSGQWCEASPNIDGTNGSGVASGQSPPPGASEGDMWFNTTNNELSIYNNNQWKGIQSQIEGVVTATGVNPIDVNSSDPANIKISIKTATLNRRGSVQLADSNVTEVATSNSQALTPVGLKGVLSTEPQRYIRNAATNARGIVELATSSESISGNSTTKAVTPKALTDTINSKGAAIPTGTVIMLAVQTNTPAGYLPCLGDLYGKSVHPDLWKVLTNDGKSFPYGGSATNFRVPDMRGAIPGLTAGGYFIKT